MKHGALILGIGGTLAALVQTLGFTRAAGAIMLAANIIVIIAALDAWLTKRRALRHQMRMWAREINTVPESYTPRTTIRPEAFRDTLRARDSAEH